MGGDYVVLTSCEYNFIRVHENLVQHPSIYISIVSTVVKLNYFLMGINIFFFHRYEGERILHWIILVYLYFHGFLYEIEMEINYLDIVSW